jgi:hypothetical protein
MKKQAKQPISNERLLEILAEEISKCNGQVFYSERRRTAEEMLRMRGVSF